MRVEEHERCEIMMTNLTDPWVVDWPACNDESVHLLFLVWRTRMLCCQQDVLARGST
jgi:hypothetical protein